VNLFMTPTRRVVAALTVGAALAVAPMAVAHANQASSVTAQCRRAWLSSTAVFGATGTFGASGSHSGSHNVSAILYYHDTDYKDSAYHSGATNVVDTEGSYSPVTGGSNYNVDAAAWTTGGAWKYKTCYIT
jgi:hypothetical protein